MPSPPGKATTPPPEEPEEICLLLLGERPEMRYALSTGAGEASILLRRLTLSGGQMGGRSTHPHPDGGSLCTVRRWKHDPGNAGSGPCWMNCSGAWPR